MQNKEPSLVKTSDESAFLRDSVNWEDDKVATSKKSERTAWIIAIIGVAISIIAVIGMATLAPLKRVVPYVFAIDKATGNIEFINAADDRATTGYQELLDKHWAQRYVISRESYNYKLLQNDYDTVLSLSADDVGREYAKLYDGANARDKKYGAGIEMKVQVLSITLAQDGAGSKAVVRFQKTTRRIESDTADAPTYFVATFAYEYKPSMFGKEAELIRNPLGYKVTSYRIDSEIAPVVNGAASAK
jgi:type IV secretion system protein VirB8